jgi:hypothetical protein
MKRLGILLILSLAVVLLGGTALAQNVGDKTVFAVTYYSTNYYYRAPDSTLRIINDGQTSTSQVEGVPNGNLYASIYVFDDSQELQECCSCYVSADGVLSESTENNLLANSLTGKLNAVGVIKVISNKNGDPTNNSLVPGLHGTMTHVQNLDGAYAVTETPLADSNLVSAEQTALQESCSFAITLGSGRGTCSCTPEDEDF